MPPGLVAYPVKLDWYWPKLSVTTRAVSTHTRTKALSRSTSRKPPGCGRAGPGALLAGALGGVGRRRRASTGTNAR